MHPDWWTIEGEITIFWSITKLGKSVRRVIREGSLALFRTSYKELSQRGIHPSSGVHHLSLKRDKLHSESAGFTLAITCLPHTSSSSSWISVKFDISGKLFSRRIQHCMLQGRGLLFMENVGNYRNCTTRITLELFDVYPIRTYPF